MKTRPLIAAMSTVLLAGCSSLPHPNCAPLQQAEKRNSKDLDAYCYTEATQDALKCAQAKDESDYLREQRTDLPVGGYVPGYIETVYESCPVIY